MFSLSQMSSLIVSIFNYNKDYSAIVLEEETEKEESEAFSSDDKYYFLSHNFHPIVYLTDHKYFLSSDIAVISSYTHKPETPPPNFC